MAQISEMGSDPNVNKYLKELAETLEKNPPKDLNGGYEALMIDLSQLLYEAYHYEFDDFRNKKYPAPKIELVRRLEKIQDNAKNGKYDN